MRTATTALLLLLLGAATAAAQIPTIAVADSSGQQLTEKQEPYRAASDAGRFEAVWPSGCSRLLTRVKKSPAGDPIVVDVSCRRFGDENRGCRVTVLMDFTEDRPPTPDLVVKNIEDMIRRLNLTIEHQTPMTRNGHEGVAVFCRERGGQRMVWTEGYIVGLKIVLVQAWDTGPELLEDQQVKDFFASVVMLEE